MRDDDRNNTSTGTSELKAVASEALQIGKRYAQGARQWINQRRSEMAQRDRDQQQGSDERTKGQRRQQSSGQEDDSQQARRSGQGDQGNRHGGAQQAQQSRSPQWGGAGGEQAEHYGDRDQDLDERGRQYLAQRGEWRGNTDQGQGGRNPQERQYPRGGGYDRLEEAGGGENQRGAQGRSGQSVRSYGDRDDGEQFGQWNTQASDQLPNGRYAGHAGADRGGQGQGRQWRSEYNNQPEARQGDLRGRGAAGDQSSQGQGYARGAQGAGQGQGGQWAQEQLAGQGHWHGLSQSSNRGRGPKGYSRSDDRIAEDLCEKLCDDDLVDASEISVEVREGIAVLSGTVEQRWMKHHVEDLAERCSGVKDVDNQVRVQRSEGNARASSSRQGSKSAPGETSSSQQSQSGEGSGGKNASSSGSATPGNGNGNGNAGGGGGRQGGKGGKGGSEASAGKQDS